VRILRAGFKPTAMLAGLAIFGGLASANNFSFTGTTNTDDQLQSFFFTLSGSGTVVMQTFGYAGGTNQAGMPIPEGGFDPFLALFDSSGNLLDENDNNPSATVDPITGAAFDSFLSDSLSAGTYELILSQSGNVPVDTLLSDGYTQTGSPNYTAANGCTNGIFCDGTAANRTGNWAVDIDNVNSATETGTTTTVPEPSTLIGLGLCVGFAGMMIFRRRAAKT
jgi:hypothetical protein